MIEKFYLDEWRQQAPWVYLAQVEQDLIISRALIDLYRQPKIYETLVFRGGTALNKIYFKPPARYSEDIDLVQIKPAPIGETIDAIRTALSWLGEPKRKLTERSAKLIYSYSSQENRVMKLKIEINTTEHFHVHDLIDYSFSIDSRWYAGKTNLKTYQLDEMMGTKLRALYQRRKGRDLFDIWHALKNEMINPELVIDTFNAHCRFTAQSITRAMFEKNLHEKSLYKDFGNDMSVLLANDMQWSFEEAFELVKSELISLLPGEGWKKDSRANKTFSL